ncbi:hypothetical protein [Paracraurococcus lichenis]|uniref:Uncharacterized protein n=1 Tax=Paracraurococcus lichenis TaxID=3064888 RepID=A0ABT9E8A9_9PROT|nr:hypothetical protein [Paracraurococcus sp. LOR1-02]MDO9712349.1 hypothetical protein [Paracraurococcus sp. LOR1-02]
MRALLIVTALLLAACSSSKDRPALVTPGGDWRQLNAGQWAWNGNEIARPPLGAAEATGLGGVR